MSRRGTHKLSDKLIKLLPIPLRGNQRYADSTLPGFAAIVTPTGYRGFVFRYTTAGRRRQSAIGAFPTWTTSAARTRAMELRRLIDQGVDPLAEPEQPPADIVSAVIAEFIKRDQQPRNRHWREAERTLNRELAPWFDRDIKSITRRDVLDVLDSIVDRGSPIRANRFLSHVRRMFGWAMQRGLVEASPVAAVRPPGREVARDRVLAPDELAAIWRATETLETPFKQIVQLTTVTAARVGEVLSMRWSDVDLDRRLWVVPAELNKAGRIHEVPLSDLALEILGTLPRDDALVMRPGFATPIRGFSSKIKLRIAQHSGVSDWRLHDLRRTAASGMARLGHPPHVVAAVLGHAPASVQGITAIYNRHRYTDEKRLALDSWSREVGRLIGGGEAKVVKLPKRA